MLLHCFPPTHLFHIFLNYVFFFYSSSKLCSFSFNLFFFQLPFLFTQYFFLFLLQIFPLLFFKFHKRFFLSVSILYFSPSKHFLIFVFPYFVFFFPSSLSIPAISKTASRSLPYLKSWKSEERLDICKKECNGFCHWSERADFNMDASQLKSVNELTRLCSGTLSVCLKKINKRRCVHRI